ncbi:MAG: DUF3006 domain-containing protein [Oscillospiraceae bacterium]|jgi:hypothetical protein|nr:DUF3006 domain-containing protein [Oscillospiraceae bacterium]
MDEILALDRIEGSIAVLETENGKYMDVPLAQLPEGTRQGSVLRRRPNGVYSLDADEEAKRRAENFALAESLFED